MGELGEGGKRGYGFKESRAEGVTWEGRMGKFSERGRSGYG